MQQLTLVNALNAVQQQQNSNYITQQQVANMLQNVHGVTFANILYVTQVKLAAANKHLQVYKVTQANVQLFNNLLAYTSAYKNAVQRSATQFNNAAQNVAAFTVSDTYFVHTTCYSIVKHKLHNTYYLFAIYNNAQSMYICNNSVLSKAEVAQLLTPSAAQQLLQSNNSVHNVTNNVTHNVVVRTIALNSIVQLRAMQQQLTV